MTRQTKHKLGVEGIQRSTGTGFIEQVGAEEKTPGTVSYSAGGVRRSARRRQSETEKVPVSGFAQ